MKKLIISLVTCFVVLTVAIGILSWLSWQPQEWYAPPDYSNPEVASLADRAEYRLNEEFHKVRPSEDVWKLRIKDDAMNAWLSGRLEEWMTHDQEFEIPKELQGAQVHVTQNGVWLAAMITRNGESPRPFSIQLWVWVDEHKLFFEPIAIRLGRVPLPISVFKQVILDLHDTTAGVDVMGPLMDDRKVEIQAIHLEDGAIVLTCQTQLPN